MYGTVARLRLKSGVSAEQMEAHMREAQELTAVGLVSTTLYQMDDNPGELYLAVVFESKEKYRDNAESDEQHERYERMLELLDGEPEWHDGEVIASAF